MKILTYPNKKLCQRAKKIKAFDENLRNLAEEMTETLFANKGMGLAAPQIGKTIRLIVIEFNPERFEKKEQQAKSEKPASPAGRRKAKIKEQPIPLTILVNPKTISCSKEAETLEEGCLSFPGLELPISRAKKVKVLGQDLKGNRIKIRAKDLFARILQHEIDHLDGILITDRVSKEKLKKILK